MTNANAPVFHPRLEATELAATERERISAIALKAFQRLTEAWQLSNEEAAGLLDVTGRTWGRMKGAGWNGRISQDQQLRLSGLIGLYKGLHLYFSDQLADRWIKLENKGPLFRGSSPVAFMLAGGLPAILQTRDYVDALRGGV
jgi:hypothetical protein